MTDAAERPDEPLIAVPEAGTIGAACDLVRAIFDNAPDGMITVDADGRIATCNLAAARLFGYRADEVVGEPLSMLVPEQDRAGAGVRGLPVGAPGHAAATPAREVTGRRRDGSTFPLDMAASSFLLGAERFGLVTVRDVTRRRLTEDALQEAEERLADMTANLPVIVFQRVMRPDGSVHHPYVSHSVETLLGLSVDEVMTDPDGLLSKTGAADRERVLAALRRSAETLELMEEEYAVTGSAGAVTWIRAVSRPRILENGDVLWDGVAVDVTSQKRDTERLAHLAYRDPLTGVLTRVGLNDRFDPARARAAQEGTPLAVLSVGLDRMGLINDTLGHAIGDELLRAVAKRIQSHLDDDDALARPGGNTFAVLAGGCRDRAAVTAKAERILNGFATPFQVRERSLEVAAAVGVALYPRDGDAADALLMNAGTALRRAREHGPGTCLWFAEEMNSRVLQVQVLESRLRRALKNDEFVPYYQPQVDMRTGIVIGMEAVARWSHARLGMIPPEEFIEVAEDAGLIGDLGGRILRRACAQNRAWQDAGLDPPPVAVNVSGRQFGRPRTVLRMVEEALADTGLDPAQLEVELTESSLMTRPAEAVDVLTRLADIGVSAAIDDFGTGYSSLSHLKQFPIAKLKIDRSFVMDILADGSDAAIVDAVIAMARALHMTVVAEGVEEREQFTYLQSRGCDHMQGLLFSPPLTADEMELLLREGRRLTPERGVAMPRPGGP